MSSGVLLITGANGFVGGHLAAAASRAGHRVWAVGREEEPSATLQPHCDRYFAADLSMSWEIPSGHAAVVHLAGLAAVGPSFDHPQEYINTNTAIMTNMSEALLRSDSRPRVVVVSSGAVYTPPIDIEAITESTPVAPNSPYAVAKIAVETQAVYYAGRGLDTVVARPFNHIGPGQGPGFIVPDLTAAMESAPPGEPLLVGNLNAERDYTDVRDVARAYLTLAFAPTHRHHLYNVASGVSHSGFDVLEAIGTSLNRRVPPLETDTRRLRPNDPPRIRGSAARLAEEFGWQPTISWQESVADYVASRPAGLFPR